ncbi:endothelial zinc finger protein induced by tumor necrosis factor alpha-like [Uranotaenia lowii]|uniref:endothelial zinc finger protein induced by tumor necrosis factor alpha-like n=1 Tax=Uranotaenia lowii TaxID=190385 RepID=UPI002478A11A|nr:endothelial zinc finger protein induced by tumor necrosis factor alpha-like [Uranotaenia lowii]
MDGLQYPASEDPCRLCLKKCAQITYDGGGMYVNSQDGLLRELPRKILECIALEVSDNEPQLFSKLVCGECICKLDYFHEFRENCRKCQSFFQEMLAFYQAEAAVSQQQSQDVHSQMLQEISLSGSDFLDGSNKDYEFIIESFEKEDISFNSNAEALQLKKELEMTIQQNQIHHHGKFIDMRAEDHLGEPGTASGVIPPSEETCFNNLDAIAESIAQHEGGFEQSEVQAAQDDLDYDDFVGIETAVRTSISEIQIHQMISEQNYSTAGEIHIDHPTEASSNTALESALDESITLHELQPTSSISIEQHQNLEQDTTTKPHSPFAPAPSFEADQNHEQEPVYVPVPEFGQDTPQPLLSPSPPLSNHAEEEIPGPDITPKNSPTVNEQPKLQLLDNKTCDICGKVCPSQSKLKIHRNTHLNITPFSCPMENCQKAFKSKKGLDEHVAKHTGEFSIACDICGKGFLNQSYLTAHLRIHTEEKTFRCNICKQATFKSKRALIDHRNRHLGLKPFECGQCGKQFTNRYLQQQHEQTVHSGARWPCPDCGKYFTCKSYMKVHQRSHTNDKPFVCKVCDRGHTTLRALEVHMTMHTGQKDYVCDICGHQFARSNALSHHRKTHTNPGSSKVMSTSKASQQ